ncbi:hypothetical protein LTS18_002805 [Coniosporium uncinatum]|uniref:Uncharacterized protein n=1 Tax=Coniosporium uncinatum TaxID=93489 RepID=A0ACC3D7T2_9PEZI|nr:hypothetical protein LTS18_002805 [Coniosporium uncinatum]
MAAPGQRRNSGANDTAQAANKPKRVRTGCLTCRERHLKCDEGLPNCQNCRKSSRVCKRGIKLNFIDTTVKAPPVVPPTNEWTINFLDESREIASEYKGGLARYGGQEDPTAHLSHSSSAYAFSANPPPAPITAHQPLPSHESAVLTEYVEDVSGPAQVYAQQYQPHHQHALSSSDSAYSGSNLPPASSSYGLTNAIAYQQPQLRDALTDRNDVLYMQVFVEEVGAWMDSMDPLKHVSRLPGLK